MYIILNTYLIYTIYQLWNMDIQNIIYYNPDRDHKQFGVDKSAEQ